MKTSMKLLSVATLGAVSMSVFAMGHAVAEPIAAVTFAPPNIVAFKASVYKVNSFEKESALLISKDPIQLVQSMKMPVVAQYQYASPVGQSVHSGTYAQESYVKNISATVMDGKVHYKKTLGEIETGTALKITPNQILHNGMINFKVDYKTTLLTNLRHQCFGKDKNACIELPQTSQSYTSNDVVLRPGQSVVSWSYSPKQHEYYVMILSHVKVIK